MCRCNWLFIDDSGSDGVVLRVFSPPTLTRRMNQRRPLRHSPLALWLKETLINRCSSTPLLPHACCQLSEMPLHLSRVSPLFALAVGGQELFEGNAVCCSVGLHSQNDGTPHRYRWVTDNITTFGVQHRQTQAVIWQSTTSNPELAASIQPQQR